MRWLIHSLLISTLLTTASPPQLADDRPSFKGTDDLAFVVTKVETTSKIEFANEKYPKQYSIELEGELQVPSDENDIVCVTDRAFATEIMHGEDSILLTDSKSSSEMPASKLGFNAFNGDRAVTELKKTWLVENAFEISSLKIRMDAVIANRTSRKRDSGGRQRGSDGRR